MLLESISALIVAAAAEFLARVHQGFMIADPMHLVLDVIP
jgi:hypothetical protein